MKRLCSSTPCYKALRLRWSSIIGVWLYSKFALPYVCHFLFIITYYRTYYLQPPIYTGDGQDELQFLIAVPQSSGHFTNPSRDLQADILIVWRSVRVQCIERKEMAPILLHIHESTTGELNCLLSILSSCRWNDWHSPAYVFETRTARFEWLYHNPYDCACKRNRPSNSQDDNPEQSVDGVGSHGCWEEILWYHNG